MGALDECSYSHPIPLFNFLFQDNKMLKENLNQIPSTPANPQVEVEKVESKENTTISTISKLLPQDEGDAGSEGLTEKEQSEKTKEYTETFSDKLKLSDLPPLLQDIAATQNLAEEVDTILLAALTLLSGAMPNVFGIYDRRRVFPPFYLIAYGTASADKGPLNACRQLLEPIEKDLEEKNLHKKEEYQRQLTEYLALDKATRISTPTPKEPAYKSIWIPANSSASACYQALSDNDGWGVTFETEADTLSIALNSEYGNFSDGLRKGFHHEPITYRRRKENEYVKVNEPRWAILLTCTPEQIPLLFKSFENGLGSRFIYYHKSRRLFWRNVFEINYESIDQIILVYGQRYKQIYDELVKRQDHPIQVILSTTQQVEFNKFFEGLQLEQVSLYNDDMIASVRRLGLVCFRITMVLTILRHEGCMPIIELLSQAIVCDDRDFNTAMTIANCLINHTAHVYSDIFNGGEGDKTEKALAKVSNQEKLLYKQLGTEFTTEEVRQAAKMLHIKWKTAERYLGNFAGKYHVVVRVSNGHYQKVNFNKDSQREETEE